MSPTNPFADPVSTNPFESDGGEELSEQQEVKEQVRDFQYLYVWEAWFQCKIVSQLSESQVNHTVF